MAVHAEVNALALVARGTRGITLLTTLEPCFLCTAAARYAQVDRVEIDLGPLSTWSGAVALLSVVRWIASRTGRAPAEELADGHVGSDIRAAQPAVAALAEVLLVDGLTPEVAAGLSLERALDRWWPVMAGGGRPG